MSHAVLIPFPTANSEEHVASTAVGYGRAAEEIIETNRANIALCDTEIRATRLKTAQVQQIIDNPNSAQTLQKAQTVMAELKGSIKVLNDTVSKCNAAILLGKHEPWAKIPTDRIVCADSPGLSGVLSNLGAGDTLYLRGHCSSGLGYLESSDHQKTANTDEIIAILKNRLGTGFAGRLKVYACESGASSGSLWWKEEAFAKKLSDAMIGAGWTKCKYFGYTVELSTWVINGHKRVGSDHNVRARKALVHVDAERWM